MKLADYTTEQLSYIEKRSNENSNWMLKEGYSLNRKPKKLEMKRCPSCNNMFMANSFNHFYCSYKCYRTHVKAVNRYRNGLIFG